MKNLLLSVACLLVVTACCSGGTDVVQVPTSQPDIVSQLIGDYNQYRINEGQEPVTPGLTCSLYTVPSGTAQIIGTTLTGVLSYTYTGLFNQPEAPATQGVNFLPSAVQSLYTSWYVVKCTGVIVTTDSNYHQYALSSDDGSLLYVNGLLVNNDGNHSTKTVSAAKLLEKGVYSFEIEYMQGPAGSESLLLQVDGSDLPSTVLFH